MAAFFLYRYFFPSAERQIIRRLDNLATDVSFSNVSGSQSNQITAGLFADRVADYFTDDVTLLLEDIDGYSKSLTSQEGVRLSLFTVRSRLDSLAVTFLDPQVRVESSESSGRSGQVSVTVRIAWEEAGRKSNLSARELSLSLVKLDNQWLISHLETVAVIRR